MLPRSTLFWNVFQSSFKSTWQLPFHQNKTLSHTHTHTLTHTLVLPNPSFLNHGAHWTPSAGIQSISSSSLIKTFAAHRARGPTPGTRTRDSSDESKKTPCSLLAKGLSSQPDTSVAAIPHLEENQQTQQVSTSKHKNCFPPKCRSQMKWNTDNENPAGMSAPQGRHKAALPGGLGSCSPGTLLCDGLCPGTVLPASATAGRGGGEKPSSCATWGWGWGVREEGKGCRSQVQRTSRNSHQGPSPSTLYLVLQAFKMLSFREWNIL